MREAFDFSFQREEAQHGFTSELTSQHCLLCKVDSVEGDGASDDEGKHGLQDRGRVSSETEERHLWNGVSAEIQRPRITVKKERERRTERQIFVSHTIRICPS